jgi:hypothetical protein
MANERDEIVLRLLMFREIESDLAGAASTRYVQAMIRELEDKLAAIQRGGVLTGPPRRPLAVARVESESWVTAEAAASQ